MRGAVVITLWTCVLAVPAAAQPMFPDAGAALVSTEACLGVADDLDARFVRTEQARLRAHFDEVLAELRAADVSGLTDEQRARRALHLERLAAYRDRGVFPRRYDGAEGRVPEFRDVHGTRCAVGELLHLGGEAELVDDVAATANSATIAELSTEPRLTRWLDENGLTLAEAGRVQPGYDQPPAQCFCAPDFELNHVESVWTAVAVDGGLRSSTDYRQWDARVELVERVAGSDARMPGDEILGIALYQVSLGDSLLVRFVVPYLPTEDARHFVYPIDTESDTVSCSIHPEAHGRGWIGCRADRPVPLDVVAPAMLTTCWNPLGEEDARLTKPCDVETVVPPPPPMSDGCRATPGSDGTHGGLFGMALFGLIHARRRRRAAFSSSGRAR